MINTKRLFENALVLGRIAFASACVVGEPREGHYDHSQNRYYGEHTWHECNEHDEHCR